MNSKPVKKTMKKILLTFIVFQFIFGTGCGKTGLHRSSLDKWERKDFPTLGISIELPVDRKRFRVMDSEIFQKDSKSKELTFSLHPLYPKQIAEPFYLINVCVVIFKKKYYEELYKKDQWGFTYRYFENTKFHDELMEFNPTKKSDMTASIGFRKDYKGRDGSLIVLCAATYVPDGKNRDTDINAIKRILNSIKFLDENKKTPILSPTQSYPGMNQLTE